MLSAASQRLARRLQQRERRVVAEAAAVAATSSFSPAAAAAAAVGHFSPNAGCVRSVATGDVLARASSSPVASCRGLSTWFGRRCEGGLRTVGANRDAVHVGLERVVTTAACRHRVMALTIQRAKSSDSKPAAATGRVASSGSKSRGGLGSRKAASSNSASRTSKKGAGSSASSSGTSSPSFSSSSSSPSSSSSSSSASPSETGPVATRYVPTPVPIAKISRKARVAFGAHGTETDDSVVFMPIGGSGEIGMNCNMYKYKGTWLMVDLGIMFGDDFSPGINVVLPDTSFIERRKELLAGIVITHAHEDHIGGLPFLWPALRCPIYATPFTAAMITEKMTQANLMHEVDLRIIPPKTSFDVGPFKLHFQPMPHSIPDSNALVMDSPHGAIFHTGDWKTDDSPLIGPPTDYDAFKELGDKGVFAVIGDSTNALDSGSSASETDVKNSLAELVQGIDRGMVIASCFSTNVSRIGAIIDIAAEAGRKVCLAGRSMEQNTRVARAAGYLPGIGNHLATSRDVYWMPRDRILVLGTGCQGEENSMLQRVSNREHPWLKVHNDDTIIFSSSTIPGHELSVQRLRNGFVKQGARILENNQPWLTHASGHPQRDQLRRLYQLLRPELAIPVHGEYLHQTAHAQLAQECNVPQTVIPTNGDIIALTRKGVETVGKVKVGLRILDGTQLRAMESEAFRIRGKLLQEGACMVTVVLDASTGQLRADPQVSMPGITDDFDDKVHLEHKKHIVQLLRGAIESITTRARLQGDGHAVRKLVKEAVLGFSRDAFGKDPKMEVHVVLV